MPCCRAAAPALLPCPFSSARCLKAQCGSCLREGVRLSGQYACARAFLLPDGCLEGRTPVSCARPSGCGGAHFLWCACPAQAASGSGRLFAPDYQGEKGEGQKQESGQSQEKSDRRSDRRSDRDRADVREEGQELRHGPVRTGREPDVNRTRACFGPASEWTGCGPAAASEPGAHEKRGRLSFLSMAGRKDSRPLFFFREFCAFERLAWPSRQAGGLDRKPYRVRCRILHRTLSRIRCRSRSSFRLRPVPA